MAEQNRSSVNAAGTLAALALTVVGLVVLCVTAVRLLHRREVFTQSQEAYAAFRSASVQRSLNRPVLPANTLLTVCNVSAQPAEITGVISAYKNPATAALRTFNSTNAGGHVWQVAPHSTQVLSLANGGQTSWDGSTIFYALHVRHAGHDSLRSGSAGDSEGGCTTSIRD